MKKLVSLLVYTLIPGVIIIFSGECLAQTAWIDPARNRVFTIDASMPSFPKNESYELTGMAVFLDMVISLNSKINMFAEFPFVSSSIKYKDWNARPNSVSSFGNLLLGIRSNSDKSGLFFDFGVRVPIADKRNPDAIITGRYADFDRLEAFSSETYSLQGGPNLYIKNKSGLIFHFRVAPTLWLYSDKSIDRDSDFLIHYSATFGYQNEHYQIKTALTGLTILSKDELMYPGEKSVNQIGFEARKFFSVVSPGVHLRIPIGKSFSDHLNFVAGIDLQIELPLPESSGPGSDF